MEMSQNDGKKNSVGGFDFGDFDSPLCQNFSDFRSSPEKVNTISDDMSTERKKPKERYPYDEFDDFDFKLSQEKNYVPDNSLDSNLDDESSLETNLHRIKTAKELYAKYCDEYGDFQFSQKRINTNSDDMSAEERFAKALYECANCIGKKRRRCTIDIDENNNIESINIKELK